MKTLVSTFENQKIRSIAGEYFGYVVVRDVADVLEYEHTNDLRRLIDDEYVRSYEVRGLDGKMRKHECAAEPGLYQVLARVRKPKAKPFQKWLFEKVIPEIRRTGGYNPDDTEEANARPKPPIDRALDLKAQIQSLRTEIHERQQKIDTRQQQLDKAKAALAEATGHTDDQHSGLPLALSEADDESEMDLTDPIVQHIVDDARELKLERPLVVFDLETTGVKPEEDRIVQIAMQRLVPDKQGNPVPCPDDPQLITYVDPDRPIPEAASAVSGITTADVSGMHTFASLAEQVERMIEDADLMGYNIARFDLPLLRSEFIRTGYERLPGPDDRKLIDCYLLEKRLISHSFGAAYERYTGREMQDAHDAWGDVKGTYTVLTHQLKRIPDGSTRLTTADLHDFARGPYMTLHRKLRRDGESLVLCFGRHRGRSLEWLQKHKPSYIHDFMAREMWYLRPIIREQLNQ